MAKIPKVLHEHIDTAFPANVCLLGSVLPNGYAQVTPRGGTMVYDDEHIGLWERGSGSSAEAMRDGSKLTIYFRKPSLREDGVLPRGGLFAIDLVPDLPRWAEYDRRVSLTGRRGHGTIRLTESVRQDRRKGLTVFDQEYEERRGTRTAVKRFSLTFRTISVAQMRRRLERAGFRIDAVLGDYDGGPFDDRADVWIILARKR